MHVKRDPIDDKMEPGCVKCEPSQVQTSGGLAQLFPI